GPIYCSIDDLPREDRFLQVNVLCPCILPGPKEPNQIQLNHALEPPIKEIAILKNGVYLFLCVQMDVHGEDTQADVYTDLFLLNCDTPAIQKFNGVAGHGHNIHPCFYCDTTLPDIDTQKGYDNSWNEKTDFSMLRQAFNAKDAAPAREKGILDGYGIHWSPLNLIPGWRPVSLAVLDFMHNIFLGVISHLFTTVLFSSYMFSGIGGINSPKQKFEDLINAVKWPSHVTRLPKNLGENQSLKKADEWRRLLTITPVLLWWVWKDDDDEIPDSAPPIPPNAKHVPEHSRNCKSLYDTILLLCAGVRILASRTITMAQAHLGQNFLLQYCQRCLDLKIHLIINHHLSMHYIGMIKRFGPVYGWWLFAFERFNGMLEKVNVNGHDGGRMEVTLLRNWVQTHLLYELLLSLPDNAHELERKILDQIVKDEARQRGGMVTQIAVFRSKASTDGVKLPKRRKEKFVDLHSLNPVGRVYPLLLEYVQQSWPNLQLVDEYSQDPGTLFWGRKSATIINYVRKNGIHYGCTSNQRTQADSFAFIVKDGRRIPAELNTLLVVHVANKDPHVCALVRRFTSDENIPTFPWDFLASLLGIHVSYANAFEELEVIPISAVDAPLALIPIHSRKIHQDLWVSGSFDHVNIHYDTIHYINRLITDRSRA
ncbi:hypothetical protein BDZ94DRAFT_1179759, partial [Collybia nuda]